MFKYQTEEERGLSEMEIASSALRESERRLSEAKAKELKVSEKWGARLMRAWYDVRIGDIVVYKRGLTEWVGEVIAAQADMYDFDPLTGSRLYVRLYIDTGRRGVRKVNVWHKLQDGELLSIFRPDGEQE